MIELYRPTIEHTEMLLSDLNRNHLSMTTEDMTDSQLAALITHQVTAGPSAVFTLDGEVLCIGGINIIWPGLGEFWLFTTNLAMEHKVSFTRMAFGWAHRMIEVHKLHRAQMIVRATDKQAISFGLFIGFDVEAVMKKFTHKGDDCVLMSLTDQEVQ